VSRHAEIVAGFKQLREDGWAAAAPTLLDAGAPLLFVLALAAVFFLVIRFSRTTAAPALFGTSALFALVHVGVWPSPVARLFLALGLGWLKNRTGSLVGPMVLHGLFNGVSCVLLLFGWA